jgi:hypothetical protein
MAFGYEEHYDINMQMVRILCSKVLQTHCLYAAGTVAPSYMMEQVETQHNSVSFKSCLK